VAVPGVDAHQTRWGYAAVECERRIDGIDEAGWHIVAEGKRYTAE
jgi:hypothetical protein